MDAAFRHPLAVRCRPGVKDWRIVAVFVIGCSLSSSMAVIFGRLDLFTLWRSSSGRPANGRGLSSSSEGLKMQARREGLPMDAAFYYQLKACRWTRPFVIDAAFVIHGDGLKMKARRERLPDRRRFRHRRSLSSSDAAFLSAEGLADRRRFRHPWR